MKVIIYICIVEKPPFWRFFKYLKSFCYERMLPLTRRNTRYGRLAYTPPTESLGCSFPPKSLATFGDPEKQTCFLGRRKSKQLSGCFAILSKTERVCFTLTPYIFGLHSSVLKYFFLSPQKGTVKNLIFYSPFYICCVLKNNSNFQNAFNCVNFFDNSIAWWVCNIDNCISIIFFTFIKHIFDVNTFISESC